MRNILKSFIFTAITGLLAFSCTEDALDDLSGKYPAPEEYNFTSLASESSEKQGSLRVFTIDFATNGITGSNGEYSGSGSVLSVQFVSDNYFLPSAAFTAAPEASAKKGNYIAGYGTNSGTCFYQVSGGTSTPYLVTKGVLTVVKSGDNYTLSGTAWLSNDEVIKVSFSGTIVYEADPDPMALTQVLYSTVTGQEDGTNLITLKLATAGVTTIPNEWGGESYGGDGNYLSVDFISSDATLAAGTYTPADNETAGNGNYVKGYDTIVDWGWGPMEMFNWGTCWFTLADDEESGVHLETGDITVSKSGTVYTITIDNGDVFAQYTGEIEVLGGSGGGEVVDATVLTNLFSASVNENIVTLKIATDGITAAYNAETWSWTYAGTGNYIAIDFYSEDGTLAAGEYTAADNGEAGPGNFVKGYDTEMWGMEFYNWGTCWFSVDDGEESGVHLTEGTITVQQDGDVYTISGNFGDVAVTYTGAVEFD